MGKNITKKLNRAKTHNLAWEFAKVMDKLPRREHINEKFIDCNEQLGCVPFGRLYGYQYCKDCFYNGGCLKIQSPAQHFLHADGRLSPR